MRPVFVGIVLILLTVPAVAQTIRVSPQRLSLAAPAGANTPVVQQVAVVSTGQSVPFTAAVRSLGPVAGWLSVIPTTGVTPATITVSANPANLAPGTYLGQITVNSALVGQVIDVYFSIGAPTGAGGSLIVNSSTLTFVGESGAGALPSQTLVVTSPSGGAVNFTAFATSTGNWLSVPPVGTTPASLTVEVNQAGLRPGQYSGTITLIPVGGGNPTIVPVVLLAAGSSLVVEQITIEPFALNFSHQIGTSAPGFQAVSVQTGGPPRSYTATTNTPWLRLQTPAEPSPAATVTDTSPGAFTVRVNPTGLTPNTYVGSITVSSSDLPSREIPVSLRVSATPLLRAEPSAVDLTDSEAAVLITGTGAANLSFTAAVPPSASSWLSVTPTVGNTSGGLTVLTIKGDSSSLAPGTYTAAVTLTVEGSGATLSIPVRLTVDGATSDLGTLVASVDTVDISAAVGTTRISRVIQLSAEIPGTTHNFTASAVSDGGWLRVEPFSGTVSGGVPAAVTISADPAATRGPGTYEGSVVIVSLRTGSQLTIPVRLRVLEQAIAVEPGSLTFVQPRNGAATPSQTVQVNSNRSTTFAVRDLPSWLRVDRVEGTTPAIVTFWTPAAVLPQGSQTATVRIVGSNSEVALPVSLSVPEPPGPTVAPGSVTFTYQLGSPALPMQSLTIGSNVPESVNFTVTTTTESGSNWLTATPSTGSTPNEVKLAVNTALVVPGKNTATLTIKSVDGSIERIIPVTANVSTSAIAVQSVLNAATLAPTPVAPGQIVTIVGTGLGPATGVIARPTAAGAIEARLADVRVMFDDVPAPLLFTRLDQINAVVPYALHGRFSTRIQIEMANTSFSVPVEVRVADAAPGLFTANGSGRGPAAALNADFTTNSLSNPAQRGSVISVFGTGEGQTDPQGQDGRIIITDLRRPILPVTATVAGRPAEVLYSGSAPSLVSGVLQVNIRIPGDTPAGAVPIEVQVGSARTQAGVTIAVR